MKTVIIYDSKHGTVEACANKIQGKLSSCTSVRVSKRKLWPKLETYDTVIIGASIHVGKIQTTVKEYCEQNLTKLLEKQVAIFLCSMTPREEAYHYIEAQFPQELIEHAVVKSCFGGEVCFDRMNFVERFMMKKITKSDQDIHAISDEAIDAFVAALV